MRGYLRVRGKLWIALICAAAALGPELTVRAEGVTTPSSTMTAERPAAPSIKTPLSIIENQGQTDSRVKFYLPGGRGTVFFTSDEVVFKLVERSKPATDTADGLEGLLAPQKGVVIRMSFPGANPQARLEGIEPRAGRINDIRGNDPTQWRKDIRTFGGVVYRDLYPGIDLEYRTDTGELERVLVVRDPNRLAEFQLRYAGTEDLQVTQAGVLELVTALGTIREAPIASVEPQTRLPKTALKYAVLSKDTVGLIQ